VGNRRYSEFKLAEEVCRVETMCWRLTIGFVDIDHFKEINDKFGHNRGDEILHGVAATLKRSLRGSDFVGRWGGEEFVFLLPGCNLPEAVTVANRMRRMVEACEFWLDGVRTTVTVSMGLTTYQDGETWETTVARADGLMYESKRAGRNRITSA
jgi:diguanylate cyclase (GGDEF)-like protein